MIKLVTQFDNEKSKLSLATPTCGCCCCCCCCCIISTFATASISARNFGNYVAEKLPNEPEKIKNARKFGYFLPLGLLGVLLGSLTYGSAILPNFPYIITIIVGIIYVAFMTSSLKKEINLPGITSRVIVFSILLIISVAIEFYILVKDLSLLNSLYFIGAIIIPISLGFWVFGKKYDNLKNSENIDNKNSSNDPSNELRDDVQTIETIENDNNNLIEKLELEDPIIELPPQKKKCSNCGNENVIGNKRCIYCSSFFETDDEK